LKRLLNTLYVTIPNANLSRDGETVVVKVEGETRLQVPIHTLGSIVCFGPSHCSPALMGLCVDRNVTIAFLSVYGRFVARVQGPVSGNVLLRREQYRRADDPKFSAMIARSIVLAKIANSRTVLLRASRDQSDSGNTDALKRAAAEMAIHITNLEEPAPLGKHPGQRG